MKAQDIDKLMQTIVSMKDHKAIKNRIEKVELRHLRGFQEDSIVEFQLPISVIVGKNGSGKSTILRSIPEDIVYDEDYIKMITMMRVIPDSVLQAKNSKEKIKKWSEESELPLKFIEEYLVFGFTKAKNEMYQNIVVTIKKMIGE